LRSGILLLKKHCEILKEKIKKGDDRCKEFIGNVSSFVDSTFK
jgi:hypothetical protein